MARIVCFSDQDSLIRVVRQSLNQCEHTLSIFPASRLTGLLRHEVQHMAPDVILLEVSYTLDNPHLFFFLRSDEVTRHVPIIFMSYSTQISHQAAILGAEDALRFPCSPEQVYESFTRCLSLYPMRSAEVAGGRANPEAAIPPLRPILKQLSISA